MKSSPATVLQARRAGVTLVGVKPDDLCCRSRVARFEHPAVGLADDMIELAIAADNIKKAKNALAEMVS